MCGLVGWLAPPGSDPGELGAAVDRMAATLVHRGPDDAGRWTDALAGIALGFRRLSILDLSPAGHQPMLSADGRYACVFNGEIYNHRDLRAELEGHGARFRGTSDTEVIVEAAAAFGAAATVGRLWGMFALAIWDRVDRSLLLARDRLGKKPLYVARIGEAGWLFGSGAQGVSRRGALPAGSRPAGGGRLPPVRVCAVPAGDLPRYLEAGTRHVQRAAIRAAGAHRALLEPPRRGARRDGRAARRAGGRARLRARSAAQGLCLAPHDRGRAAGRLPVGRDRLVGGGRAHAGAERAAGTHLQRRVPPRGVRRGPGGGGRGAPPGYGAHRALRVAGRGARRNPGAGGDLRRAVRRLLADPDPAHRAPGPAVRHRRSLGRRRGRDVRRVHAVPARADPVGHHFLRAANPAATGRGVSRPHPHGLVGHGPTPSPSPPSPRGSGSAGSGNKVHKAAGLFSVAQFEGRALLAPDGAMAGSRGGSSPEARSRTRPLGVGRPRRGGCPTSASG